MRQLIVALFCTLVFNTMIQGQCYPDRHSTNWFDGWVSCESSAIPNGSQENGHWIMYDFGDVYKLGQATVWNTNDPSHLNWGMRDVEMSVSLDGVEWTTIGTYTFAQATGQSIYEGFVGPDLGGVEGRYLLIVAENNWGGECYGLSEIRIAAEETTVSTIADPSANDCFTISASPNPFSVDADVTVSSLCPGAFTYRMTDVLGRVLREGEHPGEIGDLNMKLAMGDLPQGTYYLHVEQEDKSAQLTLVKFNKS